MATGTVVSRMAAAAPASSFERLAGLCAIAAGLAGLLYSFAFVVLQNQLLYSVALLLGNLLAIVALVALYERLRAIDSAVALLGLLLSLAGTLGAAAHGGYDLANAINPPATLADIPFAIDPRGLFTFGLAGLGLLPTGLLLRRSSLRGLGSLALLLCVLFVVIYLGRLIVLTPSSPLILVPAALAGFVLNPAWLIWLGSTLLRGRKG